jgi:outer membrane protein assembly factor BamB
MRTSISGILILTLLLFLCLSIGQAYGGSWKSYQGDNVNSGHANSTVPDNVTSEWVYRTNGSFASSPVVVNGSIYIGSIKTEYAEFLPTSRERGNGSVGGEIVSLDVSTGESEWNVTTEGGIWATAAYHDGSLYAGSSNGTVYRIESSSGKVIWRFETGRPIFSSPKVAGDTVYVGVSSFNAHQVSEGDFYVYALNVSDGSVVWRNEVDQGVFAPPAVENGTVYFGDQNGTLYAMDASDGDVRWTFDTRNEYTANSSFDARYLDDPLVRFGGITSAPTVVDGRIYFGSYNGVLYGLNESGGEVWSTDMRDTRSDGELDGVIASSPAVVNGSVYVGDYGNKFRSVDAGTGETNWNHSVYMTKPSPILSDDQVVVGTNDGVLSLNGFSGERVWSYATEGRVISPVSAVKSSIYASDTEGNLYKLTEGKSEKMDNENIKNESVQDQTQRDDTVLERGTGGIPTTNGSSGEQGQAPAYLLTPLLLGFAILSVAGVLYRRYS